MVPGRTVVAAVLLLVVSACSAPDDSGSSISTVGGPTVNSPTTTVIPPTTTGGGDPDVWLPDRLAGAPTVVLVHGGGWLGGSPSSMESMARALADRGAIVVNAGYRTALRGGGFPATFDDVACAVRFAREQSAQLGGSEDLTLVGHSAGAHIATVVALSLDTFGADCPWEGSSTPDRLVGLAGVYELESIAPLMEIFLGGDEVDQPLAWEAADPIRHLDGVDDMSILLIHGADDTIIPTAASESFASLLEDERHDVTLVVVDQANHNDVINPAVTAATILP